MSSNELTEVDMQIGRMFKVAQSALHGAMSSALRDLGLTIPIYSTLVTLRQTPGVSKADLARESFVRPQSMTRIIAAMSESGWIERPPHPEHGRILQIRLTAAGTAKLEEADAVVHPIVADMLLDVSDSDRLRFLALLEGSTERLNLLR